METFEILTYAVSDTDKASPRERQRVKQTRVRRLARLFGVSEKYVLKWLLPSGAQYGATGERNLFDRVELLLEELFDFCPAAVTFWLLRILKRYNLMIENKSSPVKRVTLLQELNRCQAVLLDPDLPDNSPLIEKTLAELRSQIDRAIGAEILPLPLTEADLIAPAARRVGTTRQLLETTEPTVPRVNYRQGIKGLM